MEKKDKKNEKLLQSVIDEFFSSKEKKDIDLVLEMMKQIELKKSSPEEETYTSNIYVIPETITLQSC